MKSKRALVLFLSGTAVILLAAGGLVCLLHRHPLAASLAGLLLLAAGTLALLMRHLPLLLCPRRAAERQLSTLLEGSPEITLLYCGSPEEDAVPDLTVPARVERREGLRALLLALPAGASDLPALLALPPDAELTAVVPAGPAEVLLLTGTAAPLPGGGPCRLRFTLRSIRLPGRRRPVPCP